MGSGENLLIWAMLSHFLMNHKAGSVVFWARHFTVNMNQAPYHPSHISDPLVWFIWEITHYQSEPVSPTPEFPLVIFLFAELTPTLTLQENGGACHTHLKIYLFLGALSLRYCTWVSFSWGEWGLLSSCNVWAFHCGTWALGHVGSSRCAQA